MAVLEYDGRLLVIDCGVLFPEDHQPGVDLILPDFDYIADRLGDIEAVVLTHGHEDHIGAVPYLLRLRPGHPADRLAADPGPGRGQAEGAPDHAVLADRAGGAAGAARGVRLRVHRGQPLDPGRAGGRRADPGRDRPAHRRLQDGPAAAGPPAHRPAGLRPARRGGRRPLHGRLDQRRGARLHHPRARHRAGHGPGLHPGPAPGHRRLLLQPRAPGAAGARHR